MTTTNMEQSLSFLLFNDLVLSVIDCGLGILTLCESQCKKLARIQNEEMQSVLGCKLEISIRTMRYMLGLTSVKSRLALAQVEVTFISTMMAHNLYLLISVTSKEDE